MTNTTATVVALDKLGRKIEVGAQIAFADSNMEGENFLVLAEVREVYVGNGNIGPVLALSVPGSKFQRTERAAGVILV